MRDDESADFLRFLFPSRQRAESGGAFRGFDRQQIARRSRPLWTGVYRRRRRRGGRLSLDGRVEARIASAQLNVFFHGHRLLPVLGEAGAAEVRRCRGSERFAVVGNAGMPVAAAARRRRVRGRGLGGRVGGGRCR